jgi:hypothetical protein
MVIVYFATHYDKILHPLVCSAPSFESVLCRIALMLVVGALGRRRLYSGCHYGVLHDRLALGCITNSYQACPPTPPQSLLTNLVHVHRLSCISKGCGRASRRGRSLISLMLQLNNNCSPYIDSGRLVMRGWVVLFWGNLALSHVIQKLASWAPKSQAFARVVSVEHARNSAVGRSMFQGGRCSHSDAALAYGDAYECRARSPGTPPHHLLSSGTPSRSITPLSVRACPAI